MLTHLPSRPVAGVGDWRHIVASVGLVYNSNPNRVTDFSSGTGERN